MKLAAFIPHLPAYGCRGRGLPALELKERDKVNHKRYIQIGEESVLQGRFIQIYKEFYTRSPVQKYCSLAVFSLGITVNYGIKKKNYKPSLDNETKRGLYKYGNFILKHDFPS